MSHAWLAGVLRRVFPRRSAVIVVKWCSRRDETVGPRAAVAVIPDIVLVHLVMLHLHAVMLAFWPQF